MGASSTGDTERRSARRGRLSEFHEKFIVEVRTVPASTKRGLYAWALILMLVGLACFFAILAVVLTQGHDSPIDATGWIDAIRSPLLTSVMIWLAILFGPVVLPIVILVVIVAWGYFAKHIWRPLLLAGGTVTGLIIVQVLTRVIGRSRPPVEHMMFGVDTTFSFPSGHVLGASDFLLLLAYLVFSRRNSPRIAAMAYVGAVMLVVVAAVSRIYLGYHWPTDALASMSLSLVILGTVIAIDTHRTMRVRGEADPAAPPGS